MSMRKIREVLRLTYELGLSVREVWEATGVGKTAVCEYVNRARVVGVTWPIPAEIGDAGLERLLFTPAGFHAGSTKRLPDWRGVGGGGACRGQDPSGWGGADRQRGGQCS